MSFKAFELVPVIEKVVTSRSGSGERPKSVECIDCAAQNLYVGTSDSFVLHYIIDEAVSPMGRTIFQCGLQAHKHLAMKKPVQQLVTAPAINRLLVLIDGIILVFSMFGLEVIASSLRERFKGVTSICRNDNPENFDPFSVEICLSVGRRKAIQILSVAEDKFIQLKEIQLPDPPLYMAADGSAICAALMNQFRYCMVNTTTGKVQELFHYEVENTKALIMRVGMQEFLLSGPTCILGMFVTSEGTSERAPISWTDGLQALGFSFPYVIVLGNNSLVVYSIIGQDQKPLKQTISFKGGKSLLNYEGGRVFVAAHKEVYCLVQLPFEKQVELLLNEKRVNEALQLAQVAMETSLGSQPNDKILKRVHQQAGFIYLSQGLFPEAADSMREGGLDPRELIALFPSLISSKWTFFPLKGLHDIKDMNKIMKGDKMFMAEAKQFILEYLEQCRGGPEYSDCKEEVDTALLKLYADTNSAYLLDLVASENHCAVEDSEQSLRKHQQAASILSSLHPTVHCGHGIHYCCRSTFFELGVFEDMGKRKRFHALALFHCYRGQQSQALDIWKRIASGECGDDGFPGLSFVVAFLSSLQDYELLWNHVPWILEKDQELGVKVFTERPSNEEENERLRASLIVEYLQRFPVALQKYLEFLVYDKKLEKEKYHTHLAVLYLEEVLRLKADPASSLDTLNRERSKLRGLLEWSSLYRVSLLLGKIKEDSDLDAESAILYGKMGQHEKALKILVYKLRDFGSAERYCTINTKGKDRTSRANLFQMLLNVYLKPDEAVEPFVVPAVSLLNSRTTDFDSVEVMKLIPEQWSIGLVSSFLTGSIRSSLHRKRMTEILSGLERCENLRVKASSLSARHGHFAIHDERLCQSCRRPFNDPAVARYPNGVITHVHCARDKSVCPVTGHVFSTSEQP